MRELVIRPPGPEDRFEKQWKWDPARRRLENTRLGVAIQVVDVCYRDTGEVHHEGQIIVGRRQELHVAIRYSDGAIAFVQHRREKVIQPEAAEAFFAARPSEIPDLFSLPTGIEELEAPHGLALHELEEVEEEIGRKVLSSARIGFLKDSPPLGGVPHLLYAVIVGEQLSGKDREVGEQIRRVVFVPPEEVRDVQTICALTQGALWRFRAWALAHEELTFWRQVAERL